MGNITETAAWDPALPRIEETDQLLGGMDGSPLNRAQAVLGNRTLHLKARVDASMQRRYRWEIESGGPGGTIVTHGLTAAPGSYSVHVTSMESAPGSVGEISVVQLTSEYFIVANSGATGEALEVTMLINEVNVVEVES